MTMTNNQRLYWMLTRIGRGNSADNIAGHMSQAEQLAVIRCAEDDRLLDPALISDPVSTFKNIADALHDTIVMCEDEAVVHVDNACRCFECGAAFSTPDDLIDGERCDECEDESNAEADHQNREAQVVRSKQI